jgi:hypothetical protein
MTIHLPTPPQTKDSFTLKAHVIEFSQCGGDRTLIDNQHKVLLPKVKTEVFIKYNIFSLSSQRKFFKDKFPIGRGFWVVVLKGETLDFPSNKIFVDLDAKM